jgi:hypothetical protein
MKSTRTNNRGVIKCWSEGQPAHSGKRALTTDGKALYSYDLKIGMRAGSTCVVADYTAATDSFRSHTTSVHVGLAKCVADLVMHPKVWSHSPLSARDFEEDIPF